jgi:hypothetical protein
LAGLKDEKTGPWCSRVTKCVRLGGGIRRRRDALNLALAAITAKKSLDRLNKGR